MSKEKNYSWGGSLLTILTAIFAVSKVFQVGIAKDWSWWQVLVPMWVPAATLAGLGLLMILGGLIGKAAIAIISHRKPKKKVYPKAGRPSYFGRTLS